jgi:SAM-dependent methyltransferase
LGRYGDPIDPEGSRKAVEELQRVLRPGGRLYLSAPIGREQVCFNAHRVFDPETIPGWLTEMSLKEFSYVNDAGSFFERSLPSQACENEYACGMYMFEKT